MSDTAFNAGGLNVFTPGNVVSSFGGFWRNKIFNSRFSVAQRGTSISTPSNNAYTLDGWKVEYDGSIGTFAVSQQTHAAASGVDNEPINFIRWAHTSAGSGSTYRRLLQPIEDVRQLANKFIALSFWAKADSSRNMDVQFRQNFGGGGSTEVVITPYSGATSALTTSWQKFIVKAIVPTISGKTIGTNPYFVAAFTLPINTSMTIDISEVQLEENDATPFEQIPNSLSFTRAQYFYQTFVANVPTSPTLLSVNFAAMRITPTVAGGASGFAATNTSRNSFTCTQTTGAVQTLTLSAEY